MPGLDDDAELSVDVLLSQIPDDDAELSVEVLLSQIPDEGGSINHSRVFVVVLQKH